MENGYLDYHLLVEEQELGHLLHYGGDVPIVWLQIQDLVDQQQQQHDDTLYLEDKHVDLEVPKVHASPQELDDVDEVGAHTLSDYLSGLQLVQCQRDVPVDEENDELGELDSGLVGLDRGEEYGNGSVVEFLGWDTLVPNATVLVPGERDEGVLIDVDLQVQGQEGHLEVGVDVLASDHPHDQTLLYPYRLHFRGHLLVTILAQVSVESDNLVHIHQVVVEGRIGFRFGRES